MGADPNLIYAEQASTKRARGPVAVRAGEQRLNEQQREHRSPKASRFRHLTIIAVGSHILVMTMRVSRAILVAVLALSVASLPAVSGIPLLSSAHAATHGAAHAPSHVLGPAEAAVEAGASDCCTSGDHCQKEPASGCGCGPACLLTCMNFAAALAHTGSLPRPPLEAVAFAAPFEVFPLNSNTPPLPPPRL
jgi:hypothetical protein